MAFIPPQGDQLPVFLMSRAYVAPALSLAAVGLLARVKAADPERFRLTDYTGGDTDLATQLAGELFAAGILRDGRLVDPLAEAAARESPTYVPPPPASKAVYYVLRESDGAVKIGLSGAIRQRTRKLADHYGPVVLLATEPGDWAREQKRHDQFRAFRLPRAGKLDGGTEWFVTGPALVRHIEAMRAASEVPA